MIIQEKEFSKTVRLPEILSCKLKESITKEEIQAIWFDKTARTEYHILWLKVKDKKEIEKSFSIDFQNTVLNESQILMVWLNDCDFEFARTYNDFILAHLLCEDNCLYNTEEIHLSTYLGQSDFKKIFNSYDEKYFMLKKMSDEFILEEQHGAWLFMIKAFTNDITYLELMLFGTSLESKTITQRLLILERFIPEVKKLLVKKNETTYYLIDYITTDDDFGFYDEFGKSLKVVQKQLHKMVLQNMTLYTENYNRNQLLRVETSNEVFTHELMNYKALNQLKKFDEVEELFLFHQITSLETEQINNHFYVFIVLQHKPTNELKAYLQSIEQNPIEKVSITSIHYTRYQIQNNLYEYQLFFNKTMKNKNKIYSSGHHPKIHWYNKKISYLDDLEFFVNHNLDRYNHDIKPIFENNEFKKYISKQTLVDVLALHLQLFIFSEAIYKPRTKNLITLWNLMLFANSSLLEKFSTSEINQLLHLFQEIQNGLVKEGQLLLDIPACTLIDKFVTTLFSHLQSSNEFKN
nr:hypothetical protein [uncultured Flavobacterium sp.]